MGSRSQRLAAWSGAAALLAALALSGCGGDGGSAAPQLEAPPPARRFELTGFQAADKATTGKPTAIDFTIQQPDGKPLTKYATGHGPHTGVHVLFVREDLSTIIHRHPPIKPDGEVDDEVRFKEPGRYRMVVDAYPGAPAPQKNFQLFKWITVAGKADNAPLPAYKATQKVGGYTLTIEGKPALKALEAAFLKITVTDSKRRPAPFTPWYGALAHAIFFRVGSLDYFHTHVCAPGASGCTSTLGNAQVTGTSQTPGQLEVGVLLPVAGTWRLFIQCNVRGKVLTAPFTLTVS